MDKLSIYTRLRYLAHLVISILIFCTISRAQDTAPESNEQESITSAALEMMKSFNYCALITLDETGQPQVRTMNPYPQEDDLVIWFATNRDSRKVKEILNDPRVNVYYSNHDKAVGYVSVSGNGEIIDDKEFLISKKRAYWESSVKDWQDVMVLIKIIPAKIELISYKHGFTNDPVTWRAPSITIKN